MPRAYKLNVNREGDDVLHIEHPWEQCNADDATQVVRVDRDTARALLQRGEAVRCQHCKPVVD